MLRNFPHQINQLVKIHRALACVAELIDAAKNPKDDGILGYEFASRRIYLFRGLDNPSDAQLHRRISEEKRKSASNQGARTFARDVRRTLELMGFITLDRETSTVLPIGQRLLQFRPGISDPEYTTLWKDAILRIMLPSTAQHPQSLRPAPIIFRILRDFPNIEKRWLALAFEAEKNSEKEYRRIKRLIQAQNFNQVMRRIGATVFQAANAVKIIPALMEQVGLIRIEGGVCQLTAEGLNVQEDRVRTIIGSRIPHRRRLPRELLANVHGPDDILVPLGRTPRIREPEVILAALAQLEEHTREHQQLLRHLVSRLRNITNLSATRDRYDLLAHSTIRNEELLFEIKTGENYLLQSRLALGQLCQYEFFDVRPNLTRNQSIIKVVVFGGEPGQDIRDFLNTNGVHCVSFPAGTFIVPPELSDYFCTTP